MGRGGRIGPACAGKRPDNHGQWLAHRDHPRMCGEKQTTRCCRSCETGSPPHVRGKVSSAFAYGKQSWITPACAGKSLGTAGTAESAGDHPRMCGEKPHIYSRRSPPAGSPPHVRGKGFDYYWPVFAHRITPACAGKSSPDKDSGPERQDHPRMCGEKKA